MMSCPSPNGEGGKRRGQYLLPLPKGGSQFKPSRDWMMPTHTREGNNFFEPQIQMLISSRNTFTDTLRKYVQSGSLLANQADTKVIIRLGYNKVLEVLRKQRVLFENILGLVVNVYRKF